jgi:hypothetical protein
VVGHAGEIAVGEDSPVGAHRPLASASCRHRSVYENKNPGPAAVREILACDGCPGPERCFYTTLPWLSGIGILQPITSSSNLRADSGSRAALVLAQAAMPGPGSSPLVAWKSVWHRPEASTLTVDLPVPRPWLSVARRRHRRAAPAAAARQPVGDGGGDQPRCAGRAGRHSMAPCRALLAAYLAAWQFDHGITVSIWRHAVHGRSRQVPGHCLCRACGGWVRPGRLPGERGRTAEGPAGDFTRRGRRGGRAGSGGGNAAGLAGEVTSVSHSAAAQVWQPGWPSLRSGRGAGCQHRSPGPRHRARHARELHLGRRGPGSG